MLAFISRLTSSQVTVLENHEILEPSDKKQVAKLLEKSMLMPVKTDWRDINSVAVIFRSQSAAVVELHSGRRIHVSGRSFWSGSEQTAAVSAIASIIKEASAREAARIAVRQSETERALRLAIQERRQRQMVAV